MKAPTLVLTLALLTACSSPSGDANAPASTAHPETPAESKASTTASASSESMPMPEMAPSATTASASGTVEAVDIAAKTITIAHGPIDALKWPAMTMTFKAPEVDLTALKQGDQVNFELTSAGMDGTVTKIVRK